MAVVVIGGHSRNIGKTSVVAGLIAALPECHWTAFKITQYGHGFCTADGAPCDCQTDEHTIAVTAERPDGDASTDSGRYLRAGAQRSLWVRTRIGMLATAMPRIRKELAVSGNAILESNSILQFMKPDVYLSVLDAATADFKESARLFLDRADALITVERPLEPHWKGVSAKLIKGKPLFKVQAPTYLSPELIAFVRERVAAA
ncbi:hypothetical protein [Acidipila sp. EB88]|uniref:hypothetical protein n=1 Tax=Acidipila sp. EB88 TaxID=2305226 RepID=UPI000F5F2833|nr:hypothetical protein [Acidipila sp. EB88]RRA49233.1 hypothetical protein D1Y84_14090 [Acidipila sp. EB88]